ncbi:MAG TPA: lipoate--protein ligase [Candidatus Limosilactobacillus faecipullorum]|nr:lipoate--protein ligase [Candidatus Limosilactobacillus faecipullorum]
MIYLDLQNGGQLLNEMLTFQALPEFLQNSERFKDQTLLYFYFPARPTVICGHYQNVYREVNLTYLREHQIDLVRRNSGGGAVFVDPGNLTYVYIDTAKQVKNPKFPIYTAPILKALQTLGITAKQTGRNDLTYQGKKFSGMSFAKIGDRVSYGGTLMVDVDTTMANKVLTPPASKLADKGIRSVKSRVTNLKPYLPIDFTVNDLRERILDQIPNLQVAELTPVEWTAVHRLAGEKYGQTKWIYGLNRSDHYVDAYFQGVGSLGIGFNLVSGRIANAKIFGDLLQMDQMQADQLASQLNGLPLNETKIISVLDQYGLGTKISPEAPFVLAQKIATLEN